MLNRNIHQMCLVFLLSLCLPCIYGFTIKYNHKVPFICEVHDIDVRKLNDALIYDLKYLFRATPVLLFKNQHLTPQQQYEFCKLFDSKSTSNIVHPFQDTMIPSCPQIALRGKGHIDDVFDVTNKTIQNGQSFRFNKVWHQDLVGNRNYLPTVVSSMYMIETPKKGGSTYFASLEKGYENLKANFNSFKIANLRCCYSAKHAMNVEMDHTGYGRLDQYWNYNVEELMEIQEHLVVQPFIMYPDERSQKKSIMLSPNKLYSFLGFTPQKSQEMMRDILNQCVLVDNNIGEIHYDRNDLLIFNNRRVMHSSSPTEEVEGKRIFSLLFLDTKEKIVSCLK